MHLHQDDHIGAYRRRSGDGARHAYTQPCIAGSIMMHSSRKSFKGFIAKHILSCHLHQIFLAIIQFIHPVMSTPNAPINRPSMPTSAQTPPTFQINHAVLLSLPSLSAPVSLQSNNCADRESEHRYNCINHVAAAITRLAVDSPQAAVPFKTNDASQSIQIRKGIVDSFDCAAPPPISTAGDTLSEDEGGK